VESPSIIRERTHLQISLHNFLHISITSYLLEAYILINALSFITLTDYSSLFTKNFEVRSHLAHLQL